MFVRQGSPSTGIGVDQETDNDIGQDTASVKGAVQSGLGAAGDITAVPSITMITGSAGLEGGEDRVSVAKTIDPVAVPSGRTRALGLRLSARYGTGSHLLR